MRIALINGSPKQRESVSGRLLANLEQRLGEGHEFTRCDAAAARSEELTDSLRGSDIIVLSFPLYIDGIPSHLLRLLESVEKPIREAARGAKLYALVNNGFFEARQNRVALDMTRNFAVRSGLTWGQGLAVGGGGMIYSAPADSGIFKDLEIAISALAQNILLGQSAQDLFTQPNFPRRLYILGAHFGWRGTAKKNGISRRALRNKHE